MEPSARLLAQVLDALPASLAILDGRARILFANAAWRRYAQTRPSANGLGAPGGDLLAGLAHASGECAAAERAIARGIRRILSGGVASFEHEYRAAAAGRERWFRVQVERRGTGDEAVLLATHEEVTERRCAERMYRELVGQFKSFLDNNPAVVFLKDARSRLLYLNRTARRRFRWKPEALLGKDPAEVWPPATARRIRRDDRAVLRANRAIEFREKVPTPDGRMRTWRVVRFPFRDASGRRFIGGVAMEMPARATR